MKPFLDRAAQVILCTAASLSLLAPTAGAQEITGAGATFPAPAYAKWAEVYQRESGVKVNYQAIGSSGGIRQVDSKTVDFGATDAPLRDEELTAKGQIQFPTLIGGVVPVVNIKGIGPGQMRLTGAVLGDIYLGKITRWSDPAIQKLNPQLSLPDAAITPVYRAEGSGTTFVYTNYLSKVNAEWKSKVGEGATVNWPTGNGGRGNVGVAALVSRTANAIGYVEYAYAKQGRLSHALVENAAGVYVTPTTDAFRAASTGIDWKSSYYQVLTNQPHPAAWPITGATFVVMYQRPQKPQSASQSLKFFHWAMTKAEGLSTDLGYAPMPKDVVSTIETLWARVLDADGKSVAFK